MHRTQTSHKRGTHMKSEHIRPLTFALLLSLLIAGFLIVITVFAQSEEEPTANNPYQRPILSAEEILLNLPICEFSSSRGQICKTFDDNFRSKYRLLTDETVIDLELGYQEASLETKDWYYVISDVQKTETGFSFIFTDDSRTGTYFSSTRFHAGLGTNFWDWEIIAEELLILSGPDQDEVGKYFRYDKSIKLELVTFSKNLKKSLKQLKAYWKNLDVKIGNKNTKFNIKNRLPLVECENKNFSSKDIVSGYVKLSNLFNQTNLDSIPTKFGVSYGRLSDGVEYRRKFDHYEPWIRSVLPVIYQSLALKQEVNAFAVGMLEYHGLYVKWRSTQPEDFDRLTKKLKQQISFGDETTRQRLLPKTFKYPKCMHQLGKYVSQQDDYAPDSVGYYDITFEDRYQSFWTPGFENFAISFWYRREVDGTMARTKEFLDWLVSLGTE